jgi:hypothetical protein
MTTRVYPIHRAIGRPILFKGLRAQYILIAAISMVINLLGFVILYCCRVPPLICIGLVSVLGGTAISTTARLSKQYGANGLMKHSARKYIPPTIHCGSRRTFLNLKK